MFLAIACVTLCFLVYLLNQHKHNFWSSRGFAQLRPKFLFGDLGRMMIGKLSIGEFLQLLYNESKHHKLLGIYFAYEPAILANDPILIQRLFITDFTKFHDRPNPFNLKNDPLQAHLFNLPGQQWRDMRVKLSPTFTSGKLKGMFPVIKTCGETLNCYLKKSVENGVDVFEFRDLMARFNTNIISSVAFGIDNDCINDPDHIFRKMGAKLFEANWRSRTRDLIAAFAPILFHYLPFKITDPEVEDFMLSIVKQTVEYRKEQNFSRNDFMQSLIQLMEGGYVSVDGTDDREVKKLCLNDAAAQAFAFFQAGEHCYQL